MSSLSGKIPKIPKDLQGFFNNLNQMSRQLTTDISNIQNNVVMLNNNTIELQRKMWDGYTEILRRLEEFTVPNKHTNKDKKDKK